MAADKASFVRYVRIIALSLLLGKRSVSCSEKKRSISGKCKRDANPPGADKLSSEAIGGACVPEEPEDTIALRRQLEAMQRELHVAQVRGRSTCTQ